MKLKVIIEDKHLTELVETFTTMFLKDQHLKGEYTFSEVPTEKLLERDAAAMEKFGIRLQNT